MHTVHDHCSFTEVTLLGDSTAKQVIVPITSIFVRYIKADIGMSGNGPQFGGHELIGVHESTGLHLKLLVPIIQWAG